MPAITMGLMMGGSTMLQSIMGGQGQAAQAAAQQAQFEFQEFTRAMDVQKKNRQVAKQNALRWQNNRNIEAAANQARAEEEFWLDYNYKNETGAFSRNVKQTNDMLVGHVNKRGISLKSQNAKQLLRQSLEQNKEYLISRRISHGNALESAKRKQDAALAQRDFGYTDSVVFQPGVNITPSPDSIMKNAMISGLAQGAMSGLSAGIQANLMDQQNTQMNAQMGNTQIGLINLGGR